MVTVNNGLDTVLGLHHGRDTKTSPFGLPNHVETSNYRTLICHAHLSCTEVINTVHITIKTSSQTSLLQNTHTN